MTATSVSIRRAGPHDAPALCRLAALDSALSLSGEVLVAEVDGEPRAALSTLTDGRVVADPFRRTAALVDLLAMRRDQLRAADPPSRARRRLRWALELAR